ncbi:MAG: hypothetical protein DRH24_09005 [Deltaproteobacteria bacterium]|nr:MAG: hypothetical protein DRH24_09005 [Deltaproteobacteria bacterium]
MRIFQAIHASTNSRISASKTWYRNLYEPLIDLGHDVLLYPTDVGLKARKSKNPRLKIRFGRDLFDTLKKEHKKRPFNLFFSYFIDGMIDSAIIENIRKLGIPTCNFSCNNVHQFHILENISPYFDYSLHSEKTVADKFKNIGANPVWWPMASNPRYYKPFDFTRSFDVTFIGANYAPRAYYIKYLLENGINVHAFGPGWIRGDKNKWRSIIKRYGYLLLSATSISKKHQNRASAKLAYHDLCRDIFHRFKDNLHQPVTDEKLIRLYSQSWINLGFLSVYDRHDPSLLKKRHLHLRDFEVPMSGALYITEYMDEIEEHFIPGKEIITYKNEYELLDKLRFYLEHQEAAEKVRLAGYERAISCHTYHIRYKTLFSDLGFE